MDYFQNFYTQFFVCMPSEYQPPNLTIVGMILLPFTKVIVNGLVHLVKTWYAWSKTILLYLEIPK